MTQSIQTHLTGDTLTALRRTITKELNQLIGDTNRSYIQGVTAAAGHKITTARLRKLLAGETDPTLLDILALAAAVDANALPPLARIAMEASIPTPREEKP